MDEHEEGEGADYAGEVNNEPWQQKTVYVKECAKGREKVRDEKNQVQDDGD